MSDTGDGRDEGTDEVGVKIARNTMVIASAQRRGTW